MFVQQYAVFVHEIPLTIIHCQDIQVAKKKNQFRKHPTHATSTLA